MQITNNTPQTFKGYGARPLNGLFMRYTNVAGFNKVAEQLEKFGQKQGFDVFVQTHDFVLKNNVHMLPQFQKIRGGSEYIWCQDNVTFLPNGAFITNPHVVNKFGLEVQKKLGFKSLIPREHVAGGNYFIINNNGNNELLLGSEDVKYISELVEQLGVNSIKLLSQADFHLDLFIRPLKNNDVLVTDDKMWMDKISEIIERISQDKALFKDGKVKKVYNKLCEIKKQLTIMFAPISQYVKPSVIQEELVNFGYNPIRVPGRIFDYKNTDEGIIPQHILNYMNAIVHENKDGELVYITNKSNLNKYCGITEEMAKKIGFDFESEFINSVKDYIKPENIYFVNTQTMLKHYEGGVHCLAAEMPKF